MSTLPNGLYGMTYDVEKYWTERGTITPGTAGKSWQYSEVQEPAVRTVLREVAANHDIRSILDAGCGWGRLTALLRDQWPRAAITGVDLSPARIAVAQQEFPDVTFRTGWITDVRGGFDLVVCSQVLMHQPITECWLNLEHLRSLCKVLVHIDWWEPRAPLRRPHSFMYNFPRYYRERNIGCRVIELPDIRQRIYVVEGWLT